MNSEQLQKLENLVTRLEKSVQSIEKGGSVSVKPVSGSETSGYLPSLDDFKALIAEFKEASQKLELLELQEITDICIEVFNAMIAVVTASANYKMPTNDQKVAINKAMAAKIQKLYKYQSNMKCNLHVKAILEGLNAESPDYVFKSAIESSEFHALKIKSQKIIPQSKWYDSFIISIKNLNKYVKENFSTGLIWNAKGKAETAEILNELQEKKGEEEKKTTTPGPNIAALFSQINVGGSITSLTPEMKNTPVQDVPRKSLSKESVPVAISVKKEEKPNVKPPRKYLKGNWFVEYFQNEKLLEIKEDETEMKHCVFIDNCENTSVMINGKVKSIFVSKCKKFNLVFKSVVSSVECVNSKNIEIYCIDAAPSIVVDKSEAVHVVLPTNPETDIVSSNVNELNLTTRLPDGDLAKDTPVPYQLLTKYDKEKGKFISKPLDLFI